MALQLADAQPMAPPLLPARNYRVLLVDITPILGGVETRVMDQARGLQHVVPSCKVATLQGSVLHERLQSEGIPCEPLAATNVHDPRLLPALRKIIRREGYQVVDAHNVPSIFWGHLAAILAGAPGRVATIHADYVNETPGPKAKLREATFHLNRLISQQYITIAPILQDKMVALGDGERSTLIPNTVQVPLGPVPAKDYDLLDAWGYTVNDFVVGIIARLDPRKGHTFLIEAMRLLRDLPQIKLLIVGDGPIRAQLEAQVAEAGIADRVRFAGYRPDPQDIPKVLQFIDCFCMPSILEGLPYSVLEAAAYARPIVTTPVGGVAALLDDRKNALLVAPRNAAEIAERIRWLAENPEAGRRLGVAAYDLILRSYSNVEAMVGKVLGVYDRAVARKI